MARTRNRFHDRYDRLAFDSRQNVINTRMNTLSSSNLPMLPAEELAYVSILERNFDEQQQKRMDYRLRSKRNVFFENLMNRLEGEIR